MKEKEIRTYCQEVRASPSEDGKTWRFEGYAAVFDSWSEDLGGFRERIARGAFKNAIERGDDVRALINHDPNLVIGRTTAGTARLSEDEHGLRFEIDAPDVTYARDLRENMRCGNISQCSFSMVVDRETWTDVRDGLSERTIEDVHLYDISIVTYPAYQATSAAARSKTSSVSAQGADTFPEGEGEGATPGGASGREGEGETRESCWKRKIEEKRLSLKEKG